jgi:integrase
VARSRIDPLKAAKALAAQREPVKTVADVLDAYAKGYLPDLKIGKVIEQTLRRELKPILHRDVRTITSDDILKTVSVKHDQGTRAMGNMIRAYASGMFTFAMARKWIAENPAAKMKKLYKPKKGGRDRVLADLEIGAILRAADKCEGPMARALRMLLISACRRSEVSRTEWSEFNLIERKWTIPGSRMKNGETAVIPLTDRMLAADVSRPEIRTGDFVFLTGYKGGCPVSTWSKFKLRIDEEIMKAEGKAIDEWTWHDLRRTAATAFAEHGADRYLVSLLLNHSDGKITATYDRSPRLAEKRKLLQWWGDRLAMLKNPPSGNVIELRAAE